MHMANSHRLYGEGLLIFSAPEQSEQYKITGDFAGVIPSVLCFNLKRISQQLR